jgi:hypothetical protein
MTPLGRASPLPMPGKMTLVPLGRRISVLSASPWWTFLASPQIFFRKEAKYQSDNDFASTGRNRFIR